MQKIIELLGADNLPGELQENIKNNLINLINGPGDYGVTMNELIKNLGADRLDERIQSELREKIDIVIDCEQNKTVIPKDLFKWNSNAATVDPVNEIRKSDYRWAKNETTRIDGGTDKIGKDDFIWGQPDSYGSIHESSPYTATELHTNWNGAHKIIYADENNKKILHSVLPEFPAGTKIDETVSDAISQRGFQIAYINPLERGWRDQIK